MECHVARSIHQFKMHKKLSSPKEKPIMGLFLGRLRFCDKTSRFYAQELLLTIAMCLSQLIKSITSSEWKILSICSNISKFDLRQSQSVIVRLGDWDFDKKSEPFETVEISSTQIIIHLKYNPKNLHNDIAVIRLSSNAPLGVNPVITSICLPSECDCVTFKPEIIVKSFAGEPIQGPVRCWVSGEVCHCQQKFILIPIDLKDGEKVHLAPKLIRVS
jgi:Trypsin